MRAYLIDPFEQSITEVEHDDSLQNIYELTDCTCIDAVRMHNGDAIYVDDEGLYQHPQRFFKLHGFGNPLAGKALVLGTGSKGESTDPRSTMSYLEAMITFISADGALQMAKDLDKLAVANEAEAKRRGVGYVHISAADIMEDQAYTDLSTTE